VRTLIVLVVTCALVLWAARIFFDKMAPAQRWAREIRQGNAERRLEAAQNLGYPAAKDVGVALPALAAGLGDDDESVAVAAARSLGQAAQVALRAGDTVAARTVIVALTGALKGPRHGVRAAALEGLCAAAGAGPIGAEEAEALAAALESLLGDESAEIRSRAAGGLGEVGRHNKIPPPRALIAALEGDRSAEVRGAAAAALGRFRTGRDAATLAVLVRLGADEPSVRVACDGALKGLLDPAERRSAAIVPALIGALASRERRTRWHAAAILGEIGPDAAAAVPSLIAVMREPLDPEMSRTQIDPGGWDPACQAARALGIVALGTRKAEDAIGALVEVVRGPGIPRRRAVAVDALARFAPAEIAPAVPALVVVLGETASALGPPATSVCFALGHAAAATPRAEDAVAALIRALGSPTELTRISAAHALAQFGARAREATPRLRALVTGDENKPVRDAAMLAIAKIEESAEQTGPDCAPV
jgi:HEAT repeat protein